MISILWAAFRLPTTKVMLVLSGLLGVGLCQIKLLGIWGAESALLLGIALPPLAAAATARLVIKCRDERLTVEPLNLCYAAASLAFSSLALPATMLALNSFRFKNCAPLEGLAFIALGPGFGVLLAGWVGLLIGAAIPWPKIATVAAIAIPLIGMGLSAYSLYATPAIFAYGHFFGFFHGSLYDEELSIPNQLLILRIVTTFWLIGTGALFIALFNRNHCRIALPSSIRSSAKQLLVAAVALAIGTLSSLNSDHLGLSTSVARISRTLDGRFESRRCHLVFPGALDRAEAIRLASECDFRVNQTEKWLGVRQTEPITAFFFPSPSSKRELTGAASTNIAKPWLNQIYLLLMPWPHPVIAHEVAHVVAKNASGGLLGLGGNAGGLWPNPALVEGLAVAAVWKSDDGMTPHQWARALFEINRAPRLSQVIGASFWGQPKRQAYALAGSLMRYIHDKYGVAALRRIYATGNLNSGLSVPFQQLQRDWQEYVMGISLPPGALELARVRFPNKTVFSDTCPHQVAILREQTRERIAASDLTGALQSCRAVLRIDPNDTAAKVGSIKVLAETGQIRAARQQFELLAQDRFSSAPAIATARGILADASWKRGERRIALQLLQILQSQPLGEDSMRMLEVKTLAIEAGGAQNNLIRDLLLERAGQKPDPAFSVYLARELRNHRSDGLPHYLEARQLYFANHYRETAELLAVARLLGLPTKRLNTEAHRLEAVSRFAAGDLNESARLWTILSKSSDLGLVVEANDWLERIAVTRAHP